MRNRSAWQAFDRLATKTVAGRKRQRPMAVGRSKDQIVEAVAVEIADADEIETHVARQRIDRSKFVVAAVRRRQPPLAVGSLRYKIEHPVAIEIARLQLQPLRGRRPIIEIGEMESPAVAHRNFPEARVARTGRSHREAAGRPPAGRNPAVLFRPCRLRLVFTGSEVRSANGRPPTYSQSVSALSDHWAAGRFLPFVVERGNLRMIPIVHLDACASHDSRVAIDRDRTSVRARIAEPRALQAAYEKRLFPVRNSGCRVISSRPQMLAQSRGKYICRQTSVPG